MDFDFINGKKLLLVSKSPRRRQLLAALGAEVELPEPKKVDESYPVTLRPEEVPAFLSRKKAHAHLELVDRSSILVAADTVVICNGEVLGKPANRHEAYRMLETLSGRVHKVVTGVTIATDRSERSFSVETLVKFSPLSHQEIEHYIETCNPLDKAGAYGIQEWIGYIGIEAIEGDYYNVMGLPLHALYRNLKEI